MKAIVLTDLPRLCDENMYLDSLVEEMEKLGVGIDIFLVRLPTWLLFKEKLPIYQALQTVCSARKILDYDIIHVQFTLPFGLVCAPFAVFHKRPVIIHTHGYDVFTLPSLGIGLRRIGFAHLLSKLSWKATTRVVAVCQEAKREIMREGVDETKIEVLYNGVDEEFFRRRKNVEDDMLAQIREDSDLIFLNVGNLINVKNQERLLIAYNHFLKRHPSKQKVMLLICGVGPLAEKLRLLAHRLGLSNNVIFLGQLPHHKMPELYSIADVFILPSLSEAHPWSLLEAMSCELPVVASNVGGIPETLEDKNLLFNPWIPSDICEAMIPPAENPDQRKRIGAKNRKLLLERFTLRHHMANLVSIYHRVCNVA